MNRSVKTITLKLHNIGRDKKNIIDEAMTNYSKAFQYLLDAAACEIEDIRNRYKDSNGKYRAFNVKAWIDKELNEKLSSFSIEPFKDSLKIDFKGLFIIWRTSFA